MIITNESLPLLACDLSGGECGSDCDCNCSDCND